MRTLVDIPDDQIAELTELAKREHVSRAELFRRAVANLLGSSRAKASAEAFGLWRGVEDGLAYQRRVRDEW